MSHKENESAKLIAAAPELLEALKQAQSYLLSFQPEWLEGEEVLNNQIKEAIEKALK